MRSVNSEYLIFIGERGENQGHGLFDFEFAGALLRQFPQVQILDSQYLPDQYLLLATDKSRNKVLADIAMVKLQDPRFMDVYVKKRTKPCIS